MVYSKAEYMICVENKPIFGKRPELYIGTGNSMLKVASFGSFEKAKMFEEFLEYFFYNKPPTTNIKHGEGKKDE